MFDHLEATIRPDDDTDVQLRALVELASSALGRAAQLDVEGTDPAALREVTLQLERLRRFADSTEAHTLAELDDRRVSDLFAGLTTSKWLARDAGLPCGVARQRLSVANRLAALAEVDRALAAGTIGIDHARVFADVVNERNVAAMEPLIADLIDASTGTVFTRWRANVTALAALLDPDGPHDPADDLCANTLALSPSDGFLLVRAELVGEHALTVHDTLNAIADELFLQYSKDRATCPELEIPRRSTLLALALEEICRRALAVDRSSTRPPRPEATFIIDGRTPGDDHLSGAPAGRGAADAWRIADLMGSPLPATTLPTFLCDPVLHAALLDSLGLPIEMGRASRTVTPAQRRALVLRDGGCAFPGCDCPAAWADAHHIIYWERGGPTDLSNLILLCRRHHRVAHRRGWTLTLDDDGWSRWTTPGGHSFWGQRHHHRRAGPAPPA